ncbi:hypothetical protein DFP91_0500 [Pseudorhodoplanes sinuspersici]|nr:hypothetical protein DFP91_0500 [Pseudorhodoplanes sinuspersici]
MCILGAEGHPSHHTIFSAAIARYKKYGKLSQVRTCTKSSCSRPKGSLGAGLIKYIHPGCGFWIMKRGIADGKIRSLVEGRDRYEGRQMQIAGTGSREETRPTPRLAGFLPQHCQRFALSAPLLIALKAAVVLKVPRPMA